MKPTQTKLALSLVRLLALSAVLTACSSNNTQNDDERSSGAGNAVPKTVAGECGAEANRADFGPGIDRIVTLSEVQRRGGLQLTGERQEPTESRSVNDGSIDDWKGKALRLGGLAYYDHGEHIYSDYLYDAWGADDGGDAQRYQLSETLQTADPRFERPDQLFQALGDQFGAPGPVGAFDHYGDATDITGPHDLTELRWAADEAQAYFYARYSRLTDTDQPALLLLVDTDDRSETSGAVNIVGTDLSTSVFEQLWVFEAGRTQRFDLHAGESLNTPAQAQWLTGGFTNALEVAFPLTAVLNNNADDSVLNVAVVAAQGVDADNDGDFDRYIPANLGYRYDVLDDGNTVLPCDTVAGIYNERKQAFDLLAGNIDGYSASIDVTGLQSGRTQDYALTTGYYERHIKSGAATSHEDPTVFGYEDSSDPFEPYEQTVDQPYGLYLPPDYSADKHYPLTFWLHYQGGKTHSAGAWSPRIITQHGMEHGNIVVTPRARGSKSWYVGVSHRDIWEVYADIAGTKVTGTDVLAADHQFTANGLSNIDAQRVYLSGYSMGGYGTYMFGLMYPDKFTAGYSTSGVHYGDALPSGQNLLANARHFPIVIHHGSFDELVPWTSIFPVSLALQDLGYRYQIATFPGYEHYTQAITDEWADGTLYLNQFERPAAPRHITYKVVPEFVREINNNRGTLYGAGEQTQFNFNPDGAWWLDGIVVRDNGGCDTQGSSACDDSVFAQVDIESFALPAKAQTALPNVVTVDNGLGLPATPLFSPGNHSTPYVRNGQDWMAGDDLPLSNGFVAALSNVASLVLDREQMALPATFAGTVTTDGAGEIIFDNLASGATVLVNGQTQTGRKAVLPAAGDYQIEVQ